MRFSTLTYISVLTAAGLAAGKERKSSYSPMPGIAS